MKKQVDISDVLQEENQEIRDKKYNDYVKNVTPTHNLVVNMIKAYIVGGIICVIGQFLTNLYINMGATEENSKLYSMVLLVFASLK
jgi:stage V sporulation protein AC